MYSGHAQLCSVTLPLTTNIVDPLVLPLLLLCSWPRLLITCMLSALRTLKQAWQGWLRRWLSDTQQQQQQAPALKLQQLPQQWQQQQPQLL
jgi:hypothetical protein